MSSTEKLNGQQEITTLLNTIKKIIPEMYPTFSDKWRLQLLKIPKMPHFVQFITNWGMLNDV